MDIEKVCFRICVGIVIVYVALCFIYVHNSHAALVSLVTTTTEHYSGQGIQGESPYSNDFGNFIPTHDVGKTLVNTQGINSTRSYTPEYKGQVDRYDVKLFQNDPEVLISKAKHNSGVLQEPFAKKVEVVAEVPKTNNDAPVTASVWLEDENGTTTIKTNCIEDNGVLNCQPLK